VTERSELLRAYASTHCILERDGERSPVAGPFPEPLPAEPLFVVTAENPGSRRLGPDENAARNAELDAALRALRCLRWPAWGEAADGSWAESGFAVAGVDRDVVVSLGERFGQVAVFELTDAEQRIVGCQGDERGALLAVRPRDWREPWFGDSDSDSDSDSAAAAAFRSGRRASRRRRR
jgi:hypothetical protein